jgi:succinate dehydrogenase hydrophobic anchor subunit
MIGEREKHVFFLTDLGLGISGTMCEYADISEQFNLLFWSTVILLTIVILTLHMVFSNDPSAKQD